LGAKRNILCDPIGWHSNALDSVDIINA